MTNSGLGGLQAIVNENTVFPTIPVGGDAVTVRVGGAVTVTDAHPSFMSPEKMSETITCIV
jgi:hypothetical protein